MRYPRKRSHDFDQKLGKRWDKSLCEASATGELSHKRLSYDGVRGSSETEEEDATVRFVDDCGKES